MTSKTEFYGATQINPVAAMQSESEAVHPPKHTPLHWPQTGLFPIEVVGESFYKDSIRETARNHHGEKALVYCTATLKLENDNPYDPNAVAILIGTHKVGHLSKRVSRILCKRRLS